jgi:hypothetical protein
MNLASLSCIAIVCLAAGGAQAQEDMTPLILSVADAPVPFSGSDGRTHLAYELAMTNFSSGDITVEKVEILSNGTVLQTLDTASVATRLQAAGIREAAGTLGKSTHALLFLHLALSPGSAVPAQLTHRVTLRAAAAPPDNQVLTESGGATTVDKQAVAVIGPPLRGDGYISADSCCDATRHQRAALPVNGRVWLAQRYAVDWEKLNAAGLIYAGPQDKLESYAIFGQPVFAVADAQVVLAIDGEPEGTPGKYPTNISLDKADGNSVILDLGAHRYALYAHMQPGSLKVRTGDKVRLGQVIGLVGDTGNSFAPHLHFQVMDSPSSLAANGLPYEISSFEVTGKTPGTAAFDKAEADGTPLPVTPLKQSLQKAFRMDQLVISFPQR